MGARPEEIGAEVRGGRLQLQASSTSKHELRHVILPVLKSAPSPCAHGQHSQVPKMPATEQERGQLTAS